MYLAASRRSLSHLIILLNLILYAHNSRDTGSSSFQFYDAPYRFFLNSSTTELSARNYTFTGEYRMWSALSTVFFLMQDFFTDSVTAARTNMSAEESLLGSQRGRWHFTSSCSILLLYSRLVSMPPTTMKISGF
jgi:GT2 family glycosyltransferase